MNYRRLGRTGLEVSEIGFGAEWMPGDDQEKVSRLVDFAAEQSARTATSGSCKVTSAPPGKTASTPARATWTR